MRVSSGFLTRRTPGVDVFGNIDSSGGLADLQGTAGIDHHRHLVGEGRRVGACLLQGLRMRPMGKAAGVEGDHALLDVVAAEEVAAVVEQHFVVVVVVMEERHLQRAGIVFYLPWDEGDSSYTIC